MLSLIRNLVNQRKEQEQELWRWNVIWDEYRRWLNEFPQIAIMLDNMRNAVKGKESMDNGWPPRSTGPWSVSNLREHLRRNHLGVQPDDTRYDKDWYAEFNKKHERVVELEARVVELEKLAADAAELLIEKNRETNTLRYVCAEANRIAQAYPHFDKRVLDNLHRVSNSQPLPDNITGA